MGSLTKDRFNIQKHFHYHINDEDKVVEFFLPYEVQYGEIEFMKEENPDTTVKFKKKIINIDKDLSPNLEKAFMRYTSIDINLKITLMKKYPEYFI